MMFCRIDVKCYFGRPEIHVYYIYNIILLNNMHEIKCELKRSKVETKISKNDDFS